MISRISEHKVSAKISRWRKFRWTVKCRSTMSLTAVGLNVEGRRELLKRLSGVKSLPKEGEHATLLYSVCIIQKFFLHWSFTFIDCSLERSSLEQQIQRWYKRTFPNQKVALCSTVNLLFVLVEWILIFTCVQVSLYVHEFCSLKTICWHTT